MDQQPDVQVEQHPDGSSVTTTKTNGGFEAGGRTEVVSDNGQGQSVGTVNEPDRTINWSRTTVDGETKKSERVELTDGGRIESHGTEDANGYGKTYRDDYDASGRRVAQTVTSVGMSEEGEVTRETTLDANGIGSSNTTVQRDDGSVSRRSEMTDNGRFVKDETIESFSDGRTRTTERTEDGTATVYDTTGDEFDSTTVKTVFDSAGNQVGGATDIVTHVDPASLDSHQVLTYTDENGQQTVTTKDSTDGIGTRTEVEWVEHPDKTSARTTTVIDKATGDVRSQMTDEFPAPRDDQGQVETDDPETRKSVSDNDNDRDEDRDTDDRTEDDHADDENDRTDDDNAKRDGDDVALPTADGEIPPGGIGPIATDDGTKLPTDDGQAVPAGVGPIAIDIEEAGE